MKHFLPIFLFIWCLASCSNSETGTSGSGGGDTPPAIGSISIKETPTTDIGGSGATVHAKLTIPKGYTDISASVRYRYSIQEWRESEAVFSSSDSTLTAQLTELQTATTYSYQFTVTGTAQGEEKKTTGKVNQFTTTDGRVELAKADPITVKVVVLIENPVVDGTNRLHKVAKDPWGIKWNDPVPHYKKIQDSLESASHGVVKYEIVDVIDQDFSWTYLQADADKPFEEKYFSPAKLKEYYVDDEGWTFLQSLQAWSTFHYDYVEMVDHYGFDEMRENDEVNEIWVCSHALNAMYESRFVAKSGGFWLNSYPATSSKLSNTKLLTVMYYNIQRGIAEAIHSNGHRMEFTMSQVYNDTWTWATHNKETYDQRIAANPNLKLNNWELFSTYDQVIPGKAQIGNIHFPANGTFDYDYSNETKVPCYRNSWKYYPVVRNLESDKEMVDKNTWAAMGGGDYQLGCMMNFFGHIPNKAGINPEDGKLNNWWHYMG